MDETENKSQIYIVGAGVSGLIAAINLEKHGYSPIILEASDRVGGRVKTDIVDGFQLDHGFQVLLDAYPKAKQYLDYDALELQTLLPGALIFDKEGGHLFGDPLRNSSFLFPTLFSAQGSLSDKWKIFRLNSQLKSPKLEELFTRKEETTLDYLKGKGFSDKVISNFFRPFFSGIYLEPDLKTSSRMFEYVYKLFGQGHATIPKAGIGAIAEQLKAQLKRSEIRFNTPVANVSNEKITLANAEELSHDFTVIATEPGKIMKNYASSMTWKSCDNLYFVQKSRSFDQAIIGLNATENALVNNLFYPTSIDTASKGDGELLSVTVVRHHGLDEETLITQVKAELKDRFNIGDVQFLKRYEINHALPALNDLQYSRDEGENLLTEKIALAGDHQLNGSLNAAMISGEAAAIIANRTLSGKNISFSG
ncbi:MAG: NAD(P)/FAD-dependent oxidoreductase [Bacteroidota bacterium]